MYNISNYMIQGHKNYGVINKVLEALTFYDIGHDFKVNTYNSVKIVRTERGKIPGKIWRWKIDIYFPGYHFLLFLSKKY